MATEPERAVEQQAQPLDNDHEQREDETFAEYLDRVIDDIDIANW